jgi:hypothetical protein
MDMSTPVARDAGLNVMSGTSLDDARPPPDTVEASEVVPVGLESGTGGGAADAVAPDARDAMKMDPPPPRSRYSERRLTDREALKKHATGPVSLKPFVVENGENKVSYAIFERVAALYPASPNQRAAAKAWDAEEGEEAKGRARTAREEEARAKDAVLRAEEAATRMMIGARTVSRPGPAGRPVSRHGSAASSGGGRVPKGVPGLLDDENALESEQEKSSTERSTGGAASRDPGEQGADLSGATVSLPGRSRRGARPASRAGSNSSTGSRDLEVTHLCGTVVDIESPAKGGSEEAPTVVIRRPIGSRRPSFVCISGIPQARRQASDDHGEGVIALVDSPSVAAAEAGGSHDCEDVNSSGGRLTSGGLGRNLRGEQGNLSGRDATHTAADASHAPAEYEKRLSWDSSRLASDQTCSSRTKDSGTDAKSASKQSPSTLHESSSMPPPKAKPFIRRPGPDAPEAARTEFSVAYSIDRAMDVISRVCREDLRKQVFRRQAGSKLRVENMPGSHDVHLVVSVEMVAVMDGLTHVKVRRSKSDRGRTAFATVWVFYDDLVTQLEVLAHDAHAAVAGIKAA